ncbi:SUMF1/EgtB/PvdO family nonheme iron enzyme [Pelomyxa schiedti]|nr:SUMF1/EgtB/PvdO family nonheme iron enzyme [Pelomyxa schiedti]
MMRKVVGICALVLVVHGVLSATQCNDKYSVYIFDTSDNHEFCVDIYEGALEVLLSNGTWVTRPPYGPLNSTETVRAIVAVGTPPVGYISGQEAEKACQASGKRLCTSSEWLLACQGPLGYTYPYGNTFIEGACNIEYDVPPFYHPVCNLYNTCDGVWDDTHMNNPEINEQPDTVAMGGQFSQCMSTYAAFDMHGNLHEWCALDTGATNGVFRGGYYVDGTLNGPGCLYKTTAHAFTYHDYSTGFRCCSDTTTQ